MTSVHVIIIGKSKYDNLPFDNELYNITIYEPKEYTNKKSLLTSDEYNENINYLNVMKIALQDNRPCLIIKNNSISNLTSSELHNHIVNFLKHDSDLFFLCTWQDECYKYKDFTKNLKWSDGSSANQAILYKTKRGKSCIYKELVLNKFHISHLLKNCITQKQIKALVCIPNLIQFDINQILSNTDYNKLTCCIIPIHKDPIKTTNNAAWILLIILFILLLVILVPYFKHYKHF